MINILPLTIESMVAILLLATILYCVRLNEQLKRLKADESSMKKTIGELLAGIDNAERAISGLKATVREADDSLSLRLKDAERFCKEIKDGTAAGTDVIGKLNQLAGARPWLFGVDGVEEPEQEHESDKPPVSLDPMSIVAAAQALAERAQARAKAIAA